jgi:hypothetical protein
MFQMVRKYCSKMTGKCMNIIGTLILFVIFVQSSFAQTLVYGNLTSKVDSIIATIPSGNGTNQYQAPTSTQLTQWGAVITKIIKKDFAGANTDASVFGYYLMQFIDTTTTPRITYYIFLKTTASSNYWGTYFFNPSPARPKLVVEAPHDLYDSYTGKQARQIFVRDGLRAFFLNGTHRCNSSSFTTCTGTTTACSDTTAKYRLSDQAHIVNGMFQKTTEILKTLIPSVFVVQPHGFGQDAGDPDIIMSNGTRYTPTTDYLIMLRNNLLIVDPTLTFKVAHVDLTWTKLIATENTQGRLINNSSNPCTNNATSTTGRFLHLEQALSGLRDSETNRKKLSDAIAMTFAADTLTITSPNGGESWEGGSTHSITWSKTGFIDSVKLEYTVDNGTHWKTIVVSTPNTGSYSWSVVPAGTWRARVRISDIANPSTTDISNSMFRIDYSAWPISGTTSPDPVASAFGPRLLSGVYDFHRGIDIPNSLNTPVHPVKRGVIVRMEDTTQTIGTSLERYGNWVLVRHDSADGQPCHSAYLHLNGFYNYHVGDTVATTDTIAFMGKSGVGINTIHTHLEYYKNLIGTSIDKDKAMNPFEVLPYSDLNAYVVTTTRYTDSTIIRIQMPEDELDFDEITFYGELATRTVGFNSRIGIDPSDNDNPRYNNVFIDPLPFTIDSSIQTMQFWTQNSEIGTIDSFKIKDVNGYSFVVVDYSGIRYAVSSGNWNGPIWAATQAGAPGSVSPPTQYDDAIINSGIVVTVSDAFPVCRSLSFGDATAKIAMAGTGVLNVYGDFTIFSTTHNAFSSWESGGKIRFTGSAKQVLDGWSTTSSTDVSTTLMEVQVDKSGDTLKTPRSDMKLALGSSVEIINGVFYLDSLDDINGKSLDGLTAYAPVISISPTGTFTMKGGASHIRSGTSGSNPIGKMTVNGKATVTTTSSLGINFGGIDINSGGTFYLTTGWSANRLNPGTVTVKSGGVLSNSTTSNVWNVSSIVTLQEGGEYKTSSTSTVFPPTFSNNGTVHYARSVSGDQTIVDTSYHRLEISYSGNNKTWSLKANRTITDSLELNNTAALVLSATAPETLSIASTLRLTSGSLNNSDPNVTLSLFDDALISRATGTLASVPKFGPHINLRYTSTTTSVATGPELPTNPATLKDLSVICDTTTVALSAPVTLNGTLTLSNGIVNNSTHNITFADGATIRRATGMLTVQPVFEGTINLVYISTLQTVTTGFELPLSRGVLNTLSIETPMNVNLGNTAFVGDRLTLVRGLLFLNDYDLSLDSAAVIDGHPADTAMVVTNGTGYLKKYYTHSQSFTYPVGDTVDQIEYTPATVSFVDGAFAADAYTGVRVLNSKHPSNNSYSGYLNRYWILSEDGISGMTANLSFTYTSHDVSGSESNIVLGQWTGSRWNIYNPADSTTHTLTGMVDGFSDFTGITAEQALTFNAGWNLISIPVITENMEKEILFPTAISNAFEYNGGYQPVDTLTNGIGYWLKFNSPQEISITGSPVLEDTIAVVLGWNMIGSLASPLAVSSVLPVGTSVVSDFYSYDGMYETADTLKPGKGYWIKATSAGTLILSPYVEGEDIKLQKLDRSVKSNIENKLNSLQFEDRRGRTIVLYFGANTNSFTFDANEFSLPPVPPADAQTCNYDVRFSTNRYVENILENGRNKIIPILATTCPADLPLEISWGVKQALPAARLRINNREIKLSGNGKIILNDPIESMTLIGNAEEIIPAEFALNQNFPNPFNPRTTIGYNVPVSQHIRLSIYNIFGQEVSRLIDEREEPGVRSIEWDASNYPSGVYYYKLQAGNEVLCNKMILLK